MGSSSQKKNCSIPFIVCICFVAVTIVACDVVDFFFVVVIAACTSSLTLKPKPSLSACSVPGSICKERTVDCIVEATLAFGGW